MTTEVKTKAKDLTFEAKAKAEDLTSEAKDKLTWPRGQGRGLEDYISILCLEEEAGAYL